MNSRLTFLFLLLVPISIYSQGMPEMMQGKPKIVVEATGEVAVVPDVAYVDVGVTREAVEASVAFKEVNEIMSKVKKALLKAGVDRKDIKTVRFSLSPKYEYRSGKQIQVGYTMTHTYRVKVRNIDKIGDVIDRAQNAGATEIGRILFSVDDPAPLRSEAREKAVKRAIQKAETISKAAGVTLGKVWRIEEVGGGYPIRPLTADLRYAKAEAGAPPPIETGEMKIKVSIKAEFLIKGE